MCASKRVATIPEGHVAGPIPILAFARYCHYQYCTVYGIQKRGGGGFVYCAIDVQ